MSRYESSLGIGANHQTHFTAPNRGSVLNARVKQRGEKKHENDRDEQSNGRSGATEEEGTDCRKRSFVSCLKKTGTLASINADEIPRHMMLRSIKSVTVRERPAIEFDFYVNAGFLPFKDWAT